MYFWNNIDVCLFCITEHFGMVYHFKFFYMHLSDLSIDPVELTASESIF